MNDIAEHQNPISTRQLKGLQRGLIASLANLPIAVGSVFVVRGSVTETILLWWLVAVAGMLALRFAATHWLAQRDIRADFQLTTHTVGAAGSGLLWGVLPIFLVGRGDFIEFAFCGFVVAGVTAGALSSLSWYRPAHLAFLFGATLPLAGALYAEGDQTFAIMASLVLLYSVVLVFTGRDYHRTLIETLELDEDVRTLARSLVATQDELARADLDKWRTISHLSHELRTPLNAVLGFSEILGRETFGPLGNPKYREYADNIHLSGTSVLQLVEEPLELSAGRSGPLVLDRAPANCAKILDDCVDAFHEQAQTAGLSLDVETAAPAVLAYIDEKRLRLAVTKIVENAVRYTPANGCISVSVALAGNDDVTIVVNDTGAGMSEDEISQAMEPFSRLASPLTSQHSGIGLGLPLARLIAEAHDGQLEIESRPGKGTTVTLRIPRNSADLPTDNVVSIKSARSG